MFNFQLLSQTGIIKRSIGKKRINAHRFALTKETHCPTVNELFSITGLNVSFAITASATVIVHKIINQEVRFFSSYSTYRK